MAFSHPGALMRTAATSVPGGTRLAAALRMPVRVHCPPAAGSEACTKPRSYQLNVVT